MTKRKEEMIGQYAFAVHAQCAYSEVWIHDHEGKFWRGREKCKSRSRRTCEQLYLLQYSMTQPTQFLHEKSVLSQMSVLPDIIMLSEKFATNKMREKMIKKYFWTSSSFRQELIDRREKREILLILYSDIFELC